VEQGFARLPRLFVGERQIVMGVGVGGRHCSAVLLGLDGFLHRPVSSSTFPDRSRQARTAYRIQWRPGSLSASVLLPVVVERAHVNVGGGTAWAPAQSLSSRLRIARCGLRVFLKVMPRENNSATSPRQARGASA